MGRALGRGLKVSVQIWFGLKHDGLHGRLKRKKKRKKEREEKREKKGTHPVCIVFLFLCCFFISYIV